MERLIYAILLILLFPYAMRAQGVIPEQKELPLEIYSGEQGRNHVQGIAYDARRGCMYMSFTTSLVKLDLHGNLLASVTGLTGHLGCLALDVEADRLYASLEYKHDAIGNGIARETGAGNDTEDGFYIASFNLDALQRPRMDAREVMRTVYVGEAVEDYRARVWNNGRVFSHRHGCSGIDGIAVAPSPGGGKKRFLYVAYGVYGEEERTDNDYQVLLCYSLDKLRRYEEVLSADNLHKSGPKSPVQKYFVYTGNTTFGIQNLTYDSNLNCLIAAVYPGRKPGRQNFSMFAISLDRRPTKQRLAGVGNTLRGKTLSLLRMGLHDESSNVWGWHFKYGSTGLCALGDGMYYVSHNERNPQTGRESCRAILYRWTGKAEHPLSMESGR